MPLPPYYDASSLQLFIFFLCVCLCSSCSFTVELERRGKRAPPEAERIPLIERTHLLGHFGRDEMFKKLYADGYWWPKMRADIGTVLDECDPCTRFVVTQAGFHPAVAITANVPWDHIQVDTSVHLPPSDTGHTALLVVTDVMTGFTVLRPCKNTEAETIARKLWKIFCLLGLPKIMQSDNGSEFVNAIIRALVKIAGIDHRLISPWNPRADGLVERKVGISKMVILKLLHGTDKNWPLFVPAAQLSVNNKIATLTGSSAFVLMFARPLNPFMDYTNTPATQVNLENWKEQQEKIISVIYPGIRARVKAGKDKMVERLNAHRKLLLPASIPAGSHVMLKDPNKSDKQEPYYVGP